jgi:hypothetical protein
MMQLSHFSKPSAGTRRYVRYYVQREAQLGTSTVTIPVPARAAHLLDFEFGNPIESRAPDTAVLRRPDTAALVGLETYRRHHLLIRGNIESFAIQFQLLQFINYLDYRLPTLPIATMRPMLCWARQLQSFSSA